MEIAPQIRNLTMRLKEEPDEIIRERAETPKHLEALSAKLEPTATNGN